MKIKEFAKKLPLMLIPLYLIIDLVTKLIVVNNLPYQKYVPVIGNFAGWTYIFNTGAAFGLFSSLNPLLKDIIFTIVTFSAIGFIFYLMRKTYRGKRIFEHSCALILGGALGNVFDRLFGYMIYGDINIITGANAGRKFEFFFSRVVDFINIGFGKPTGKWRWPYFNVADSCITIGLVILVFLILFNKDKKYGEKLPNNDENTETKEEAIQE